MLTQLFNWWLCLGEPSALHETKIEFFKKAKEAKVKDCKALWALVKMFYPNSLACQDIDQIIASVR